MVLVAVVALMLQDSPLKPLLEVGKRLEVGAEAFLKGAAPSEAWKPWTVASQEADVAALRETLKKEGVAKLSNVGFELELVFRKPGGALYLRTFVHATAATAAFLKFDVREGETQRALPLDAFKGDAAPFAEAARALAKVIQAREADKLPFVDPAMLKALIPSDVVLRDALKELETARKGAAAACAKIAAFGAESVEVAVDDQAFTAADKGLVRTNFRVTDDGKFVLELTGQYRPYPK